METNFTIRTNKSKKQITITINGSKYRTLSLDNGQFAVLQDFNYFDWVNYIRKSGNIVAL